jgi:hypothetical protein
MEWWSDGVVEGWRNGAMEGWRDGGWEMGDGVLWGGGWEMGYCRVGGKTRCAKERSGLESSANGKRSQNIEKAEISRSML